MGPIRIENMGFQPSFFLTSTNFIAYMACAVLMAKGAQPIGRKWNKSLSCFFEDNRILNRLVSTTTAAYMTNFVLKRYVNDPLARLVTLSLYSGVFFDSCTRSDRLTYQIRNFIADDPRRHTSFLENTIWITSSIGTYYLINRIQNPVTRIFTMMWGQQMVSALALGVADRLEYGSSCSHYG